MNVVKIKTMIRLMFEIDELPLLSSRPTIDQLESAIEYEVHHFPIKRIFDFVFSIACLTLGLPLFLIIALVIFVTSPGKVIYSHQRVGRGGKLFRCYKFRTMVPNAEEKLAGILAQNPTLREEWQRTFKLKQDPRVFPFGAFLRKTSLDELPQFWNVMRGDLSVVGPRPVVQEEVKRYYGVKAYKILSVRPGLTGPWQVSGRSDIDSYAKRVALDEEYIDNHNFVSDLKLIAKTIPAILLSKGAY